jgi:hypothetical protein
MTTQRRLVLACLLSVSAAALACASDPNKQASDAHDAELSSQRKEVQDKAEVRSGMRIQAAELQRQSAEGSAQGTPATQDRAAADAKLAEARAVYRAKATERLDKLTARAEELKLLGAKAGGKATTASRDALTTAETQRGMVAQALERLPSIGNDDWSNATQRLDGQLDTLEGLVKKAANEGSKSTK